MREVIYLYLLMLNLIDRATNRLVLNPRIQGGKKYPLHANADRKSNYIPAFSQKKSLEYSSESIEERYIPSLTL